MWDFIKNKTKQAVEGAIDLASTVQNGAQKAYIEIGHGLGKYTGVDWVLNKGEEVGVVPKEVNEGARILGEGTFAATSEVIFHPYDSVANLLNVTRNMTQRVVYSPKKEETFPNKVQDPVIVGVYHVGGDKTPPGHVALWYKGETVDAYAGKDGVFDHVSFNTVFRPNQGEAGSRVTEWEKDGPFVFGTKDCDFYVVDAARLGFDTPEKKKRLLDNIIRERNSPNWDINSENCATRVNRVTEDAFLDAPRLHSPGFANFDFPISIGAKLDRMCLMGEAHAITPEALDTYGKMLAQQNQGKKEQKETVSSAAPTQSETANTTGEKSEGEEKGGGGFLHRLRNAAQPRPQTPTEPTIPTQQSKPVQDDKLTLMLDLRAKKESRS